MIAACWCFAALGLQAGGYRAVVVADTVSTPPPHHAAGLARLRDAGVTISDAKGVFYELTRDLATTFRVSEAIGVEDAAQYPFQGCASDYTL